VSPITARILTFIILGMGPDIILSEFEEREGDVGDLDKVVEVGKVGVEGTKVLRLCNEFVVNRCCGSRGNSSHMFSGISNLAICCVENESSRYAHKFRGCTCA